MLERGLQQPKGVDARHKGLCSCHSRDLSNYDSGLPSYVWRRQCFNTPVRSRFGFARPKENYNYRKPWVASCL